MRIPEEVMQEIRDESDIVEIISEVVRLKKSGRNHTGLCPFHHEKTPSFSVSSDKQIYKCFGCGEAGNVFTFIMKTQNMTYMEAVRYLAKRADISIEYEDEKTKSIEAAKEKLYKLNIEVARYFYRNITINRTAQQYFKARGIGVNTIKKFGLGYADNSWNALLKYLKSKGYTELDMLNLGLIIKSEKGNMYDRFRNRVMFPVFDYRGKVIGFGGRVLDASKPKYLNSPESTLFQKGTNLYGLNFAIKNNSSRVIVIVEGYMDCISLHQYGISNAVASLGTALTVYQAKLLKRYADKVILAYDADGAGVAATMRGMEILRNEGFDVRILRVPSGKDPDEFVRANGKEAFENLMENALPLIEYKIKEAGRGLDFKNEEHVIKYVSSVTDILSELNPVQKDVYIKKMSQDTGIKEQAIYDLLNNDLTKKNKKDNNMNNIPTIGYKLYIEPAYLKAERTLLKIMYINDECYKYILETVREEMLIISGHKKIFELINAAKSEGIRDIERYVEDRCEDIDSSKEWIIIKEIDLMKEDLENKQLIIDYVKEIKKYKLEEEKNHIMAKIKKCEENGQLDESLELARQLIQIKREIEKA
ncbi:DNA primase [Clostridium sp. 19966]|uniref:DNA primase n=1 Tax=Clostridium sp. 19966 TaxID=2768166 RepID=UPI0028DD4E94|nr:DNA primase [Clostridium sp. 19966]MDT8715329.1 DNA primase [Clostridium sp. 19966]